jgi:hypothetical protein
MAYGERRPRGDLVERPLGRLAQLVVARAYPAAAISGP